MAELQPHKSRYWLNAAPKDPVEFDRQVREVRATYRAAPERLSQEGIHTVCVDEKTGIQALERIAPTKPMRPGQIEKREFEYERHGTQCLIGNFEVATGQVIAPTVQETRDEADFARHIERTIATDPAAGWIFVADNLTTHCSETLVLLVAGLCGLPAESLGEKEKSGVLKSVPTRQAFLRDPSHRVRFVYVPKHTSWLNQVEIWFSVLARRVIRRGNFRSKADLRDRILKFIDYFNATMAKPYKWTYAGRPLNV
jgi:DDE superfamily endonuclease